jgi:hypothetical protein
MRALIENRQNPQKETIEQSKVKIDSIQKDLSLRIILQRKKLLHRLNLIKLLHERKRSQMRQNIMNIRRSSNEESLNKNKIGNEENCILYIGNEIKMRNYCTVSYHNDAESMIECKKNESFCSLCCDYEFGEFHLDKRDQCLNKCDQKNEEINYNMNDKKFDEANMKNYGIHLNEEELSNLNLNKMLDSLK